MMTKSKENINNIIGSAKSVDQAMSILRTRSSSGLRDYSPASREKKTVQGTPRDPPPKKVDQWQEIH